MQIVNHAVIPGSRIHTFFKCAQRLHLAKEAGEYSIIKILAIDNINLEQVFLMDLAKSVPVQDLIIYFIHAVSDNSPETELANVNIRFLWPHFCHKIDTKQRKFEKISDLRHGNEKNCLKIRLNYVSRIG